jgi:hypothetical protein
MSLVGALQDLQRIYGFCPCCGEPFRLSDATLFYKRSPPRTPFDELEDARRRLAQAEDRLAQDTERLRERAQLAGRQETDRRLRLLTRVFRQHRIAIRDVRLLFHPVDYVAFRGLCEGQCRAVEFLDHEPRSAKHERLQRSIHKAIRAGDVSWITMTITDEGRVTCT